MAAPTVAATAAGHAVQSRPRLVIVDDEPDVLETVTELMRVLGCDVHPLANAAAAIEFLRNEPVDGVLVDMRMPEVDGTQLVAAVRKSEVNSKALIAVMTGHSDAAAMEASFAAGASVFISKPVSELSLRKVVNLLRAVVLKDTRGSRRKPLAVHVNCTQGARVTPASCVNLSEGGILLDGLKDAQIGDQINVEFSVPGTSRSLKLGGKVIRKDTPTRAAVSFSSVPLSQRDVIRQFLALR